MELKGLPKRPPMLKRMKAPRRHHRPPSGCRRRDPLQPAPVGLATKRRNHNMSHRPGSGMSPDEPCSAGTEQPFMAAGNEEVAAQLFQPHVLHSQSMHAVDTQKH